MLHFHWRLVREDYALAQVVTLEMRVVVVVVVVMVVVVMAVVVVVTVVVVVVTVMMQGHTLGMNAYLGLGAGEEKSRDARNK